MCGAVAVGMFGMAQVGAILSFAHYISVLLVGLTLRFMAGNLPPPPVYNIPGATFYYVPAKLYIEPDWLMADLLTING